MTATVEDHLTSPGMAIGTVAYMSPEQARGEMDLDSRTDLFSLGTVLYEMATGQQCFSGAGTVLIFDAVLHKVPTAPVRLNPELPAELERIINKALEKERDLRYQTASELRADLKRLRRDTDSNRTGMSSAVPIVNVKKRSLVPYAILSAAVILAAAVFWDLFFRNRAEQITVVHTRQLTFAPGPELDPAVSPDGKMFAYVALVEGNTHVFVRQLAGGDAIDVTRGFPGTHRTPRWSPDGTHLLFASRTTGRAAIYLVPNLGGIPKRLSDSPGGTPAQITDNNPQLNVSPAWLPDSKSLLFVSSRDGNRDVYRVGINESGARAQLPARLTTGLNAQTISLSNDGKNLVYSVFNARANIWSIPITEKGPLSPADARPVTSGNQSIEGISVSPDDRWIAFDSSRSGNQDIYKMPLPNGEPEQVTSDPAQEGYPDWSPDGMSLVFFSYKTGNQGTYITSKDNTGRWGTPRRLTSDTGTAPKWSPDGKRIAYILNGDIQLIPPEGGESIVLVPHQADSGDVYAAWSRDGRILFYKSADPERRSTISAVPASGGTPRVLLRFDDPLRPSLRSEFAVGQHDIFFTMTERESDIWVLELSGAQSTGPFPHSPAK